MLRRFLVPVFALALSLVPVTEIKSADLDTIVRRGKLIVAVKDNLPPLGFVDERGALQGFEIDIAKRLAEEILGDSTALDLRPVKNSDRLQVVIDDRVDLAIARVTVTPARSRVVDFSAFYYLDSTGFITLDPGVASRLHTARIGVLNGSSTIAVVKSNYPDSRAIGVNSYREALDLLEKGEIDTFAADNSLLAGWERSYPRYRRLPVALQLTALSIVLPRGLQYQSLRYKVNTTIERLRDSGWLAERARYWGLSGDR